MRNVILAAIVVLSLLAVGVVALLVFQLTMRESGAIGVIGGADGPTSIFVARRSEGNRQLLLDQSFSADGIKNVELDLGSDTVDVHPSEDGQFRVIQYGLNLTQDRVIEAANGGGTLSVTRPQNAGSGIHFQFGITYSDSWVELYIPASYNGDLDLKLSSGSMKLNCDLDLKDFSAKLSSGTFRSNNAIKAQDADIKVTSGNIDLASVDAADFDIDVSSGVVRISSLSGSGDVKVTSGTVTLDSLQLLADLEVKVSSGALRMKMADDPSLRFAGKTSSGSINTYFETYYKGDKKKESFALVGDGPYKELTAQVTSGTIRIDGSSSKNSAPGDGKASSFPGDWDD